MPLWLSVLFLTSFVRIWVKRHLLSRLRVLVLLEVVEPVSEPNVQVQQQANISMAESHHQQQQQAPPEQQQEQPPQRQESQQHLRHPPPLSPVQVRLQAVGSAKILRRDRLQFGADRPFSDLQLRLRQLLELGAEQSLVCFRAFNW